MNTMFSIGDRVRINKTYEQGEFTGRVGTVEIIRHKSMWPYRVRLDNSPELVVLSSTEIERETESV